MTADARGWRIALLADVLMNPPHALRASGPDTFAALDRSGYGVLQLPPSGNHGLLLAVIADQVAEYSHHGYAVVAVGLDSEPAGGLHWRRLAPLLRHRGAKLPPRFLVRTDRDASSERQRLSEFLDGFDLPRDEQKRWRV